MQSECNIPVKSNYHLKPIVSDVFYNANKNKKPVIIFCHGYKGYKDWGAWDLVAQTFAKQNFFFVKFNFSHNGGTLNDPIDFPDLKAFGENNFTTELNDLEDIINWTISNEKYKDEINVENITLIGHSRGGGIVTLKAAENQKISNVITWNGVSDFGSWFPIEKDLEAWKNTGVRYVTNGRTKQEMPHFYQFYEDFINNEERLTIKSAVEKIKIPQLIISGSSDSVVPPIEGKHMHLWNAKSKWIVIDNMNHTLGSKHPWTLNNLPHPLGKTIKESIDFIK